jgi:WD40 repeat protein
MLATLTAVGVAGCRKRATPEVQQPPPPEQPAPKGGPSKQPAPEEPRGPSPAAVGVTELGTLAGDRGLVQALAFSRDGKVLASGHGLLDLKLWDVSKTKELATLPGHKGRIDVLTFSPDGRLLASGDALKVVRVWDVRERKFLDALAPHRSGVSGIGFFAEGRGLAVASSSYGGAGEMKLWDLTTGRTEGARELPQDTCRAIAYSPDGQSMASTGGLNGTVVLYRVPLGAPFGRLTGHTGTTDAVAFSPDGTKLATGGFSGIKLWDVATKTELASFPRGEELPQYLAFSADGKVLVSVEGLWWVRCWDVAGKKERVAFRFPSAVGKAALSSTGVLAGGVEQGAIKLWDLSKLLR